MKVKIKAKINRNTVEEVMEAFCKIVTPEKRINFRDSEVSIEIFLEDISKEMIAAICKCEEIVFGYGQISINISKQDDIENMIQKLLKEKSNIKIAQQIAPEVKEIAEKCNSYEQFIVEVTKWLDLGIKSDFFINLVKAATDSKDVTWANIKTELQKNEIYYSDSDKTFCGNRIAEKFEKNNNPLTILKLIKILVCYKYFEFCKKEEESRKVEETSKYGPIKRIKINCMPEIQWFEEFLGSINKTKSIRQIVKTILITMGLRRVEEEEQMKIIQIVYVATISRKYKIEEVLKEADIPEEEHAESRLILSNFINKFLERNGFSENVNEAEFLADLVKILV